MTTKTKTEEATTGATVPTAGATPADNAALAVNNAKRNKRQEITDRIAALENRAQWAPSKEAVDLIAELEREIKHICTVSWLDEEIAKDMRAIDSLRAVKGEKESMIRKLRGAAVLDEIAAEREALKAFDKDTPLFAPKAPANGAAKKDEIAAAREAKGAESGDATATARKEKGEAQKKLEAMVGPDAPKIYDGPPLTPECHVDLRNAGFMWFGPANPKATESTVTDALAVLQDARKKDQKRGVKAAEEVLSAFGWRRPAVP